MKQTSGGDMMRDWIVRQVSIVTEMMGKLG